MRKIIVIPLAVSLATCGAALFGSSRLARAADSEASTRMARVDGPQMPGAPGTPHVTTIETSEPLPSRGRLGGVSIDRAGNIYVSNFGATVWRVAPDGSVHAQARNLRGSSGNTVDGEGNLLQASFLDGRIIKITPDGGVTDLVASGLEGPVGLAAADDGSTYVCSCRANSLSRVTPEGSVLEFARSPDFDCPNGIALGPDGALYIASFNNGHIVRVDPSGSATRFATVPGGRNAHIASAGGALWVTKIETHTVYRLAMDGSLERFAGTGKPGFRDGPVAEATLAHPNGIAASADGRTLVVNTLEGEWRGQGETRIVLRRIELPAPGSALEHIQIPVGDLTFDALATGPEGGELVLLLHGFPQTGYAFQAQLLALGAAGYRAVAPDQRGYSPAARPEAIEAYAMGELVADVVGMADALGRERFHLVGHDWGGAVAWVTATRYPNRVRTLTVLSTPHFRAFAAELADPESEGAQRSSYIADFAAPGAEERFLADDRAFLRELLADVPESSREAALSRLGSAEALRAALNWYRASGLRPARTDESPPPAAPPSEPPPQIPPIRVRTLYIWGTEDGAFSRAAAEKTRDFVTGPYEFHALPGVGHWVPELAADTVNRLLLHHLRSADGDSAKSLGSYRKARRTLENALQALGGRTVTRLENLEASYQADGLARGQSHRPGPPFDSTHAAGRFLYEPSGRLYHVVTFTNVGGTDRSFRRALLEGGSWNYWIARDLLTAIQPSDVAFLRAAPQLNIEKALPHSLVKAGLDNPAALRWLGSELEDARRVVRISLSERDGQVATLVVDEASGRPLGVERLGSDRLEGDAVHGIRFHDYHSEDGLLIPRRLVFTLNGEAVSAWTISEVQVNQSLAEDRFAPPAGVDYVIHPQRFAPRTVAPGVHVVRLYSGPANSYNTVLVEFSDHIVVLESPLVDAFVPVIRQIATAVAPGKPIRSVVTTHHHHDHAGGVRRFLAEGVDVIAPPHALSVIRTMSQAKHTIAPAPRPETGGRFIPVADSLVLSDSTRTIRLLQVGPTPHVEQILIAHLPTARLLFVADLFAVPESRVFPPASPTFEHFAALVEEFDLAFDTIVPTHGLMGEPADLEAALAR